MWNKHSCRLLVVPFEIHWSYHRLKQAQARIWHTIDGSLVFGFGLFQNGLHHRITKCGSFGETWCEVLRNPLETMAVGLEVTEGNTVRPCLVQGLC